MKGYIVNKSVEEVERVINKKARIIGVWERALWDWPRKYRSVHFLFDLTEEDIKKIKQHFPDAVISYVEYDENVETLKWLGYVDVKNDKVIFEPVK